jgi:hypothetical protein
VTPDGLDQLATQLAVLADVAEQFNAAVATPSVLIWSNEHGRWWAPDGVGYTSVIQAAGRYTLTAAAAIVERATVGGQITVRREGPAGQPLDVPPEVIVIARGLA